MFAVCCIDAVTIGAGAFFVWAARETPTPQGVWDYHVYWSLGFLATGLFFAVFRLFCWYVLKRTIKAESIQGAWWPVVFFWMIVIVAVLPVVWVSFRQ